LLQSGGENGPVHFEMTLSKLVTCDVLMEISKCSWTLWWCNMFLAGSGSKIWQLKPQENTGTHHITVTLILCS